MREGHPYSRTRQAAACPWLAHIQAGHRGSIHPHKRANMPDTEFTFPEAKLPTTRKTARTELPKPPAVKDRRPIREVLSNRPTPPTLNPSSGRKALSEAKLLREEVTSKLDGRLYNVPQTTYHGESSK